MAERESSRPVGRITIVDNVITKGSTLLGAASEAQPKPIRKRGLAAFALVRTKKPASSEGKQIDDPCLGKIPALR